MAIKEGPTGPKARRFYYTPYFIFLPSPLPFFAYPHNLWIPQLNKSTMNSLKEFLNALQAAGFTKTGPSVSSSLASSFEATDDGKIERENLELTYPFRVNANINKKILSLLKMQCNMSGGEPKKAISLYLECGTSFLKVLK